MSGIGVNLRVTGHCSQGGRKYMEDTFSVAYQQTEDLKDIEYAYFGIFDGHGGAEAALYAKDHLIDAIVSQSCFWSEDDGEVLRAIHDGYINTHYAMWKHHENWPRTASGLPSTSGTTATVAFIKKGKIYLGHVGDSCIVLGYQNKGDDAWKAKPLTIDHKPETRLEIKRITECGGKVVSKSGVPRVVWNRPRLGHKGPVRRSTPIDEIPFLAVARSLGDFWSYNSASNKFVVSPEPDVSVHPVDVESFRCLILGTDGLWNMLSPHIAVTMVQATEDHNKKQAVYPSDQFVMQYNEDWINPSKMLVEKAVKKWEYLNQRADNTSVVTLMFDPPGPPEAQILASQKQLMCSKQVDDQRELIVPDQESIYNGFSFPSKYQHHHNRHHHSSTPVPDSSSSGVAIFTRYPGVSAHPAASSPVIPLKKFSTSFELINNCNVNNSNLKNYILKGESLKMDKLSNQSLFLDSKRNSLNDSVQAKENSIGQGNLTTPVADVSINAEPQSSAAASSPNTSICDKRKRLEAANANTSYNFRLKQKLKLPEKEDERNSDVENIEQWSQRWSEVPSSSSQSSIKKSKTKKRRYSFEQHGDRHSSCRCSSASLSTSLDKQLHKHKAVQEATTRILRSDTIANTPIRTLRSRNIDLSMMNSKPKTEEFKAAAAAVAAAAVPATTSRNIHSKSCLQRPSSPKSKTCGVRAGAPSSYTSCPTTKKLSKVPCPFEASSSTVTTRRNGSKRLMK